MIEETISQLGSLYVAPRARKINIRSSSRVTSCILALTSTFSGGLSLLARSTSISVPIANSEVTFVLLANPYNHGGNTVREIFANTPALPDGTMVYKYDPATDGYFTNVFNNGTWDNSGLVINPGEGFFFSFNSQAARTRGDDLIVAFSGDLPASVKLPPQGHFGMVGSPIDKSGFLVEDLGYPASEGDYVYKFNVRSQTYSSDVFLDGRWESGSEPYLSVGDGFFVYRRPKDEDTSDWFSPIASPPGACLSALPMGGPGPDYGQAITIDPKGNVFVGGSANSSPFVAKRSPSGTLLWSIGVGGAGSGTIQALTTDSSGNLYVAGQFGGTLNFGGGPLVSAGGYDIFVAEYSSSGAHLWSKQFGGSSVDSFLVEAGFGLAVDPNENTVVVTGIFNGQVDFGGGTMTSTSGQDMFLVKFTSTGGHVWSKCVGGGGATAGNSLAMDGTGNIFVTGSFSYTVDFGSGPRTAGGYSDMFIAKYSSTGANLWVRSFGTNLPAKSTSVGTALALDRSGDVVVTGNFQSSMSFGGPVLTAAGYNDIYVAKYSSVDGACRWAKSFGGANYDVGNAVTVDANGNIAVAGQMGSNIDFGLGPLQGAYGGVNVFVASFAPDGAPRWNKRSVVGLGNVRAAATSPSGHLFLTGAFTTKAEFGDKVITGFNGTDIYLAEFAP